jgi:hypothetical protein
VTVGFTRVMLCRGAFAAVRELEIRIVLTYHLSLLPTDVKPHFDGTTPVVLAPEIYGVIVSTKELKELEETRADLRPVLAGSFEAGVGRRREPKSK